MSPAAVCDYSVGNYSAERAAGSGVRTNGVDPQLRLRTRRDRAS